jgi:hypothetical protein
VNETLTNHYADVHFQLEKSLLEETANYMHNDANLMKVRDIERQIERLTREENHLKQIFNDPYIKERCFRMDIQEDEEKTLNVSIQTFIDTVWEQQNPDFNNLLRQFIYGMSAKKPIQHTQRKLLLQTCEKKYQARIDSLINSCETLRKEQNIKQSVRCFTPKCQGYISPDENECMICKRIYCKDCGEECKTQPVKPVKSFHTCNPDTVKTLKLLNRDTKPCPNCKERIYKISGCDQMFCTNCHTAFDWQSNTVIKGKIHNPHLTEYLQNKTKLELQNKEEEKTTVMENKEKSLQLHVNVEMTAQEMFQVENLVPVTKIDTFLQQGIFKDFIKLEDKNWLGNAFTFLNAQWNFVSHIVHTEIPQMTLIPIVERYREFRIRFLRGSGFTESYWKTVLTAAFKRDEVIRLKGELLEAFVVKSRDAFLQLYQALDKMTLKYSDPTDLKVTSMKERLQAFYNTAIGNLRWYNTESKKLASYYSSKNYQRFVTNFKAMELAEKQTMGKTAFEVRIAIGNNVSNELECKVESIADLTKYDVELTEKEEELLDIYHAFLMRKNKLFTLIHTIISKINLKKYQENDARVFEQSLEQVCKEYCSIFSNQVFLHHADHYETQLQLAKKAKERMQVLQMIYSQTVACFQQYNDLFTSFLGTYCYQGLTQTKKNSEDYNKFCNLVSNHKEMETLLQTFVPDKEVVNSHKVFLEKVQIYIKDNPCKIASEFTPKYPLIQKQVMIKNKKHIFTYPAWFDGWFFNMDIRLFQKVSNMKANGLRCLFPEGTECRWNGECLSIPDAVCSLLFTATMKERNLLFYAKLAYFSIVMEGSVYGKHMAYINTLFSLESEKEFMHALEQRVVFGSCRIPDNQRRSLKEEKWEQDSPWNTSRIPIHLTFQEMVINYIIGESKRLKGRVLHYHYPPLHATEEEACGNISPEYNECIAKPATWMHYYMWKQLKI